MRWTAWVFVSRMLVRSGRQVNDEGHLARQLLLTKSEKWISSFRLSGSVYQDLRITPRLPVNHSESGFHFPRFLAGERGAGLQVTNL